VKSAREICPKIFFKQPAQWSIFFLPFGKLQMFCRVFGSGAMRAAGYGEKQSDFSGLTGIAQGRQPVYGRETAHTAIAVKINMINVNRKLESSDPILVL
jgi:hypothetical protein